MSKTPAHFIIKDGKNEAKHLKFVQNGDKIHFIANDRYKKCQEKQRGAVVIS